MAKSYGIGAIIFRKKAQVLRTVAENSILESTADAIARSCVHREAVSTSICTIAANYGAGIEVCIGFTWSGIGS